MYLCRWGRGEGAGRRSQFSTRRVNAAPLGNLGVYSSQARSNFEGEIPPPLGHHEVYIWGSLIPQFLNRNQDRGTGQEFVKDPLPSGINLLGRGSHFPPHTLSRQRVTALPSVTSLYLSLEVPEAGV